MTIFRHLSKLMICRLIFSFFWVALFKCVVLLQVWGILGGPVVSGFIYCSNKTSDKPVFSLDDFVTLLERGRKLLVYLPDLGARRMLCKVNPSCRVY